MSIDEEKLVPDVVDEEYGEGQIQVLEGLDAVRKRPGMYIGSTGERGLHHLVYEIVDNSVDEALAGHCSHIEVEILPDNVIGVRDNGRGIPVGMNEKLGLPSVTVVLTVLHAGGKFGGGGYKVAGGLHGVGSSVVNALSEWLEVEVSREGHTYHQRFEKGKAVTDLKIIADTDETGTYIRFKPDPEIFTDTTEYAYTTLEKRMREQAFLNGGLKITLTDKRDEEAIVSEVFHYEGGISEFVTYNNRGKHPLHDEVIHLSLANGNSIAEIALQYTDSYSENILSFANNMLTVDGGTHEQGFKTALQNTLNGYARKFGLLKDANPDLKGEDCREGLTAIISVKLEDAQFESQTKAKLGNTEMRKLVGRLVKERLEPYLEENPAVARAILDKAIVL